MTNLFVTLSSITVGSTDEYTSGAEHAFQVQFNFSQEWDGLTKLVTFKAADAIVSQIIENDKCFIPHEVLMPKQDLWVGVLGTKDENVVLPTVWKKLRTVSYGIVEGAFPADPTPSQYQQILNIAQTALQPSALDPYRTATQQDLIDIEKIDKSAQAPKTAEQTEAVGIDENGRLWSKTGGGGASDWSMITNKPFDSIGENLKVVNGVLSVDTAPNVEKDNTKPITSAAVFVEVGNINTLLALI